MMIFDALTISGIVVTAVMIVTMVVLMGSHSNTGHSEC